ncbi:SurA N-terminal domain-containing protein [Halomonas shantousis]
MLQRIREGSQGWIAKVIVGAIIVTFAFFGVESLVGLFSASSDAVATVNGEDIKRQEVELQVQRSIRSGQVPPEQERELRAEVIDQLISRTLLEQYAQEGGMTLSEAQLDQIIVGLPEFQDQNGRFSSELFRNKLASAGYTPLSFRQELRVDMLRQQLQQGLAQAAFVLPSERERLAALQNQARDFRYAVLGRDDLSSPVEVSDEEAQAYYASHQQAYQRPEQVRLRYIVLDKADLAEGIEVSEEQLREAYTAELREAPRRVSHIMVSFGEERSREEARGVLQEVQQRLAEGADFAELAAEYSDDAATAESGGDLGVINRGFFGEAFENAAFGLQKGQVSQIVETENGLHLLKVTGLEIPPYEEMQDQLAERVRLAAADDVFNERAQQLIDESFAADDLASVAEDLDLTVQESDWVSRDDASGVLAEPGVMDAAFTPDVLEEGYNSEVLELDDQRRMVLRVAEHRPATTLPLEEVEQQVRSAVEQNKAREALMEQAATAVAALRNGESPDLDWRQVQGATRQGAQEVPQAVLAEAFRLPHPQDDPTYGTTQMSDGVAVVALTAVNEGSSNEEINGFVVQLAERLRAQTAIQGLNATLRQDAEIERH